MIMSAVRCGFHETPKGPRQTSWPGSGADAALMCNLWLFSYMATVMASLMPGSLRL